MNVQVPTYGLYGENDGERPDFWLHCESIASRSRLHRWEIKAHRHASLFQLLYVRGGMCEAIFGETIHPVHAPAVITVPPSHPHGFRFSHDVDGLVMTFVARRVQALAESAHARQRLGVPRVTPLSGHADLAYLADTLDRIGEEAASEYRGGVALVETHLMTALLLLARMDAAERQAAQGRDAERLEALRSHIARHFHENRPIGFYAGLLGISTAHLNRIAGTLAGRSVGRMVGDKIMEEARRELIFTVMTVRQIALRLGFEDPAYFSRFFTQRSGITPAAYRKREQAGLADRASRPARAAHGQSA